MNIPPGFIEATLSDPTESLQVVIVVDQIAAVKMASQYGRTTKVLVILKSGETLQLSSPFDSFVERLKSTETEKAV